MNKIVFVDTNVLLNSKFQISDYDKVYISIVSIQELDNLKRNERLGYQARSAIRNINNANNVEIRLRNGFSNIDFLEHNNDNIILSCAYDVYTFENKCIFLTDDYALKIKAGSINLPCRMFEFNNKEEFYKGYKKLSGDTKFINNLFQEIENGINSYDFLTNEYLILHNEDLDKTYEYRFDGEKFVDLKLPPSKIIKGHNSIQRCTLDLLNNKNIPIKVIAGGFGTGKTMLSVKVGLYHTVDKGTYGSLMYIRNPIPVDDTDIGFLPGSKSEKIYDYCKPFLQYIESDKNQFYADDLIKDDKIKMDAVSFLKGVSIEDTFVIVDEAEDLNLKLIKTVGSRIGKKACVVFAGDWQQSEEKYKYNNGLLKLIQQKQGDPLMGVIVLDEVLRSPVSKLFNDLK